MRKLPGKSNDEIYQELVDIKLMLESRKHLDDKIMEYEELINGNGKPGLRTIRDKVLSMETKMWAIVLLLVGQFIGTFLIK